MKLNISAFTVIGAMALAAAAGTTYALVQPSQSEVNMTPDVSTSVAPTVSQSSRVQPTSNRPIGQPAVNNSPSPVINQTSTQSPAAEASSDASRTIESCVTRMAIVNDPNPPLNVRSSPETNADSNIVGQLKNGTFVTIANEQNGWFQILTPVQGWVSKQNTESGCNQKVERISFGSATSTTIVDRFIGTGSHKYLLRVTQGQQLTINRNKGPFPTITAPDGTRLVGIDAKDERRSTWTGALPQTGDYSVELDSNFRGYRYSFLVEIK